MSADETPAAPESNKDTIVIAEDSTPNRKILSHLLQKLGYEVIACSDGQEAWDAINGGTHPRLVAVISDIMMPQMDGISLLRSIREHATYAKLPVVLVTALSDKEYIVQAKELSVNGYILKPVTFQRVTAKMQELFPGRVFPKLAA